MDLILPVLVGIVGGLLIIERRDMRHRVRAMQDWLRERRRLRTNAMIKNDWSTAQYYGHALARRVADVWSSVCALLRQVRRMGARS